MKKSTSLPPVMTLTHDSQVTHKGVPGARYRSADGRVYFWLADAEGKYCFYVPDGEGNLIPMTGTILPPSLARQLALPSLIASEPEGSPSRLGLQLENTRSLLEKAVFTASYFRKEAEFLRSRAENNPEAPEPFLEEADRYEAVAQAEAAEVLDLETEITDLERKLQEPLS